MRFNDFIEFAPLQIILHAKVLKFLLRIDEKFVKTWENGKAINYMKAFSLGFSAVC